MSNHQRQIIAPVHFLFWYVPFMVLTAQTRSLWSALRLQNETLTSTRMRYSRKLALAADRQAGFNEQGSACRAASSLPWHSHAQCPRKLWKGGRKHHSILETFGAAAVVCWEHPVSLCSLRDRCNTVQMTKLRSTPSAYSFVFRDSCPLVLTACALSVVFAPLWEVGERPALLFLLTSLIPSSHCKSQLRTSFLFSTTTSSFFSPFQNHLFL